MPVGAGPYQLRRAFLLAALTTTVALTACTLGTPPPATPGISGQGEELIDDPDLRAELASEAAILAEQLGILDPPPVEPIRLIEPDEYGETMVRCLNDAGFTAQLTADGEGVSYPHLETASMIESLDYARYVCESQFPLMRKYLAPLSGEQLSLLYHYRADELIDCLSAEGYPVTQPSPGLELFVSSGGAWSPYEGLDIAGEDVYRLFSSCPQDPEDLYGE